MSRLIDANRMKTMHEIQMGDFNSIESVQEWIDRQPTAYSVEAVVRELEELAKLHARHQLKCEEKGMDYCADRHEHKVQALDEAIAIVKRGGRNEGSKGCNSRMSKL